MNLSLISKMISNILERETIVSKVGDILKVWVKGIGQTEIKIDLDKNIRIMSVDIHEDIVRKIINKLRS